MASDLTIDEMCAMHAAVCGEIVECLRRERSLGDESELHKRQQLRCCNDRAAIADRRLGLERKAKDMLHVIQRREATE